MSQPPSFPAGPPAPPAPPAGYGDQPGAPRRSDADPSTPFFWAIVLLPLLGLVSLFFIDLDAYVGDMMRAGMSGDGAVNAATPPGLVAAQLISWGSYALTVVLAFFDWRALRARGIDRPFPWPWAFLSVVYVIGRTVVVKRRTGRGLAPLFVYIAVWLLSVVVTGIVFAQALAVIGSMTPGVPAGS